MSRHRINPATGWRDHRALPKGPNGRAICRCGCGVEVPVGRRGWASQRCVDGWKDRNDPARIRRRQLERDHGVCAVCGRDCVALERELRRLTGYTNLRTVEGVERARRRMDELRAEGFH